MTRRGALVWAILFTGSNLVTYEATRTHMERTVIPAAVANEKFRTMEPEKTVCRVRNSMGKSSLPNIQKRNERLRLGTLVQ